MNKEKRPRSLSILIDEASLEELSRQARLLGYQGGTISIYVRDRLTQLAEEGIFSILPQVIPSWPPSEKSRSKRKKFWFLK